MPTLHTDDDVAISYRVLGTGPKDVLFIHCWGNSSVAYDPTLEAMDLDGLRLIVPDLRGAGASGRPEGGYTLETFARDVMQVADAERSTSFTLVGHSMGAQIAMWIASTAPERVAGLVMLSPIPPSGFPLSLWKTELLRTSAGNAEKQKTIYRLGCNLLKPEVFERLVEDAGKVSQAAIEQGFDTWSKASFVEQVRTIRARTLIIASDDPYLPQKRLRESVLPLIKGARLAYLPGAGHHAASERPHEVAALIQSFLA
jgi:pimeloyl-ACP methyl ester carboxylesterase